MRERIRERLRYAAGLASLGPERLAPLAGIGRSTFYRIWDGESLPKLLVLAKLATHLGVEAGWLLGLGASVPIHRTFAAAAELRSERRAEDRSICTIVVSRAHVAVFDNSGQPVRRFNGLPIKDVRGCLGDHASENLTVFEMLRGCELAPATPAVMRRIGLVADD